MQAARVCAVGINDFEGCSVSGESHPHSVRLYSSMSLFWLNFWLYFCDCRTDLRMRMRACKNAAASGDVARD